MLERLKAVSERIKNFVSYDRVLPQIEGGAAPVPTVKKPCKDCKDKSVKKPCGDCSRKRKNAK